MSYLKYAIAAMVICFSATGFSQNGISENLKDKPLKLISGTSSKNFYLLDMGGLSAETTGSLVSACYNSTKFTVTSTLQPNNSIEISAAKTTDFKEILDEIYRLFNVAMQHSSDGTGKNQIEKFKLK